MHSRTKPISAGRELSQATLRAHSERLSVPSYDRRGLTPGVVHVGVGGFHRAHQAMYLDTLAESGISSRWGIVGVGLRSPRMKNALKPQDGLYTLVERDARGDRARVIGAMTRYLFGPDRPAAVLSALAHPRTQLVTVTVTGDGYGVDPLTGELDLTDPGLAHDLREPRMPVTLVGYLAEALRMRRRVGLPPFTVLSCDNVPSNGTAARRAIVSFASLRDESLGGWIDREGAFPSSVVDRITPETTPQMRELVAEEFGVRDRWPVIAESFSQWIVEDSFCGARPPLEQVGAQLVSDAGPYELAKKRMLNGAHCALGYLGYLAGHRRTDEALADPAVFEYADRLIRDEIQPLLPSPPDHDLDDYRAVLLERFANPAIGDRLQRLCGRGSTKMPAYLLPSLHEALERGLPHGRLTLALAGWLRYLRGTDFEGRPIEVKDALAERLQPLARAGGADPRSLLAERSIFGDLSRRPDFVDELSRALALLDRAGPRGALLADAPSDYAAAA